MPRYIDADAFCEAIIKWGEKRGQKSQKLAKDLCACVDVVPTADVVPKSEVARIFEEIEKILIGKGLNREGWYSLAEIKEKYTEGQE